MNQTLRRLATLAAIAMCLGPAASARCMSFCVRKDATTGNIKENAAIHLRSACRPSEKPLAISIEDGEMTVRFTGVNVQIVSGSGTTDGATNGKGNLIVGYNGATTGPDRSGSHNVVIGDEHAYASFGGLIAGYHNSVDAPYSTVSGGGGNTASGLFSSVSAGYGNKATGEYASVTGGFANIADGGGQPGASVCGGYGNGAYGLWSTVSGGNLNAANGAVSSISGGSQNQAFGYYASISGGFGNYAGDAGELYTSVSGGLCNVAGTDFYNAVLNCTGVFGGQSVSGGAGNIALNSGDSVSGGSLNTASGYWSSVSGGVGNTANFANASVSGGQCNVAGASVPCRGDIGSYPPSVNGGLNNVASGLGTTVGGGSGVTSSGTHEWHAGQMAGFPTGTEY